MELKMAMKSISDIDFGLNKLSHKSEAFHSKIKSAFYSTGITLKPDKNQNHHKNENFGILVFIIFV